MHARAAAAICMLWAASAVHAATDVLTGDWRVNGGGATLRIGAPAADGGSMTVTWLDGPDWSIEPGTLVGTATPGSEPGVYDLRLAVDPDSGGRRSRTAAFAVHMPDGDTLDFRPYNHRTTVSLWRWVPYLFRVTVVKGREHPEGLDGARRVGATPRFVVL